MIGHVLFSEYQSLRWPLLRNHGWNKWCCFFWAHMMQILEEFGVYSVSASFWYGCHPETSTAFTVIQRGVF